MVNCLEEVGKEILHLTLTGPDILINPHLNTCLLIFGEEKVECVGVERGERERERERNTDVREKHRSIASGTLPDLESNLQPRYVP